MTLEKALNFLRHHIESGPDDARMLHLAVINSLSSADRAILLVSDKCVGSENENFDAFNLSESYFLLQENRGAPSGLADNAFLALLEETNPGCVLRRYYLVDSPLAIRWGDTEKCADKCTYGYLRISNGSDISAFIDGAADYIHFMALYPPSQARCDFDNPIAAAITVCRNEGILLVFFTTPQEKQAKW